MNGLCSIEVKGESVEFSCLINYLGMLHHSECLIFLIYQTGGGSKFHHLPHLLVVRINGITWEKCLTLSGPETGLNIH